MKFVSRIFIALALVASMFLPFSASARPVADETEFGSTTPAKSKSTGVYIVELADAPLVSYRGTVGGLRATSPAVLGARKLNTTSSASVAYRNYLTTKRTAVLQRLNAVVGRTPQLLMTYDAAFNGFAVSLSPAEAAQVAALPGVRHVASEKLLQLQTDTGPGFIGAMQKGDVAKPALFKASINGANEKPTPVTTSATGKATFTYDAQTKALTFQMTLAGITPTMQHIHRVVNPNGTGPVAYDLLPFKVGDPANPAYVGTVTLSGNDEVNLYAGKLYVNFHTAVNMAGEVRGDIVADKGEGMIVGIIDSGINFSHKSFAAVGGDGYTHINPLGAGKFLGVCDPTNALYDAAFKCNDKLIGAWTFKATATSPGEDGVPSPSDDDGHGSHTASTTAGNVTTASIVGVDVGTVSGVAPHANIIAYDVCGYIVDGTYSASCPTAALVGAIDQATKDGVDVINFSIGGGNDDPWFDPTQRAFLNALDAGVLSSVSAGNSGPTSASIGSPSNAPWVMSVAASTHNRTYNNAVTIAGTAYTGKGLSGPLVTPAQVVLAKDYQDVDGDPNLLCYPFKTGTDLAGKIIVCDRGVIGRVEKAENAQKAGAAGFVLSNTSATQGLNGDVYPIPSVHVTKAVGDAIKAAVAAAPGVTGTIQGGVKNIDAANGDLLASFSSRGPDVSSPSVLKPDVAAPGVDIIAALANTDPNSDEFGTESGTSMAAPHNAGAATLIRALHPEWSASEVRSALMLTAITDGLRNEGDLKASTPFAIGAGRIDVRNAARSGLLLDESADGFFNSYEALGGDPRNVNIASLADPACVVTCTWTRTFTNTIGSDVTWNVNTSAVSMTVSVQPSSFTIAKGRTQTITITADVSNAPLDEYVFGSVTLTPAAQFASVSTARLPIAVQAVSAKLPVLVSEAADGATGSVKIANLTAVAINDLTINAFGLVPGQTDTPTIKVDPTGAAPIDDLSQVFTKTVTVPTNAVRFVTEVITTTAIDLDMYVYRDSKPADGKPQAGELICTSAGGTALERCDIPAPMAGNYIIVVQNFDSKSVNGDSTLLSTAVVPDQAATNFTVTGPKQVAPKTPFDLTLTYNLPVNLPGTHWYGALMLATQPSGGIDLGYIPVDLVNTKYGVYMPLAGR